MEQVEKFNQIIDEVYEQYWNSVETSEYDGFGSTLIKLPTLSQEQFINKCKTDLDFSQKWGLTIEERELSLEERAKWLQDNKEYDLLVGNLEHDHIREVVEDEAPTKLITTKYQNETIESYE